MDEKIIYEYCLLRYVADIERGEFVNIGLMMMSKRYRWMRCELNIDAQRISALFRNPDIDRLRIQSSLFTRHDVPSPDITVEERYRWLVAVKSAIIQTSPSHPGLLSLPAPFTRQEAIHLLDTQFHSLFHRLVL